MKNFAKTLGESGIYGAIAAIAVALLMASCGDDTSLDPNDLNLTAEVDTQSEAAMESAMEDLDNVAEAAMIAANAGGRFFEDELLGCATVTHDEELKTVIIDFGEGCEGPRGRMRSGKIVITYTDRRLVPGAVKTVAFEDFAVDSVGIEGTRIFTNIMESENDFPKFRIQLIGGRLTFPDATVATRESDHTRTWIRGANPLLDEAELTGTSHGIGRDGRTYEVTILERIIYKRDCGRLLKFLPVSGVKQIIVNGGEHEILYDYGDGECDNIITITKDGVSEEVEIDLRRLAHIAKNG
ncbi:MAG: hypothetical protein O2887_00040 [Bacteroidetes bacterium]|nr:hypothetical protein [Bacteroidota bacterium]MDA1118880.1 hypothetical protein [Bacteroidota bacterium]